jgi:methionine biosynthesis protein MetW
VTYDTLVAEHGLSGSHRLLLEAVPRGARTLDVGCAGGYLAVALRDERGADVVGLEADAAAVSTARSRGVEVLEGSAEDPGVHARLAERGPFDAIVCGDVLEHLVAPEEALRALARLLRPGGVAVVSVPNIAHWTARREVLRGRFPRTDHGLFDRTHLRWFTRSSAHALVSGAGLQLRGESFVSAPLPLEAHVRLPQRLREAAARRRPELFALQFVLVGMRPGGPPQEAITTPRRC